MSGDQVSAEAEAEAHKTLKYPVQSACSTTLSYSGSIQKTRMYRHINRNSIKIPNSSSMGKSLLKSMTHHLSVTGQQIRTLTWGKTIKCYVNINKKALRSKLRLLIQVPNNTRRIKLNYIIVTTGCFHCNGRPVCTTFLHDPFKLHRDLQISVKKHSKHIKSSMRLPAPLLLFKTSKDL